MRNKELSKKSIALILALAMVVGSVVGGTIAWLTAGPEEVKNVFTTSSIGVDLKETTTEFKMIPGWTIEKDPKASVDEDSEDCYLFVKIIGENAVIKKEDNSGIYHLGDYIVYAIAEGWTAVPGVENVFYKKIDEDSGKGVGHIILGEGTYKDSMKTEDTDDDVTVKWNDNSVAVKPSVTESMMEGITEEKYPTLSFTAYAVQLWKTNEPTENATEDQTEAAQFTPEEAWKQVSTN